jgi:hypothetical protein
MKKRVASFIVTAVTGLALMGAPAEAVRFVESATSYANCDALQKRWQYGVAKSRKAARRQVRTVITSATSAESGIVRTQTSTLTTTAQPARC